MTGNLRSRVRISEAIHGLLVILATCASASGQFCGEWTEVAPSGPNARSFPKMAYDSRRDVIVMFGGSRGTTALGDTWEWDGSSWERVATTGPDARTQHAMVFDSVRGVTVLFGGTEPYSTKFNDTWEWDGFEWRRAAIGGPSPRFSHDMAFDSARGVTVLYGGWSSGGDSHETWEWNGQRWKKVGIEGPPANTTHTMTYDDARSETLLFGGGSTWSWDGFEWTRRSTEGPSDRGNTAMAFDAMRQVAVLFGGGSRQSEPLGDTWQWDGSTWTRVANSGPAPRDTHDMVYDSNRGRCVVYGGADHWSTWAYGGTNGSIHLIPLFSTCPQGGSGAVSWSCGSPDGVVVLLFAERVGSFRIPYGPCRGWRIGLGGESVRIVTTGRSDARGRGRIEVTHGKRACGGLIQLLDLATCAVSETAIVQ